jgi:hypothetical protein
MRKADAADDWSGASALVWLFADVARAAGDDPPPAKPSRRNDRLYPFTIPYTRPEAVRRNSFSGRTGKDEGIRLIRAQMSCFRRNLVHSLPYLHCKRLHRFAEAAKMM